LGTVKWTGGSLSLPDATVLKNLTIVVENGDVNFNGDRHLLENVRLLVLNGSVNLGDVQGQNLSVYAARSIHMNQAARFSGKNFLGTQNGDVIFNGSTVSSSFANSLKVVANGNIYVNASVNAHASFLASGSFTANYDSAIVGSIRTQGGITFNASVHVSTEIQALIGVIDTGFNGRNPDIDYSRVMTGRDRIDNDNDPFLFPGMGSEHGTHIAGIIGATRDNGFGIDGINDQAPLWLGRAVGSGNWADSLIEFVDAAKQAGQPHAIANLSFDLTQRDASGRVTTRYELTPQERKALEYARQNGVLIVVPSGNDGGVASVLGQASQEFANIITVGAVGSIDGTTPTGYSNRGRGLNIVAYGGDLSHPVLSTVGNGVGTMIGTSVAAAGVTGAASKVWEANPTLNALQVKEILLRSAIDLGAEGWDVLTGNGRLNLDGAIALAQQTEAQPYNPAPFLIPKTWGGEGKVTPIERPANVHDDTVNLGKNPTSGIRRGTLTPVNFTDYFNFSVTNRQEATVGFNGIQSNTGLILSLHDSSGQSLGQLNSEFVGPHLPITKVLEPGEYFIKVTADQFRVDSNSEYNLRLGFKATNPDPVDPGETPNPGGGGVPDPGSGTPIPIPTPIVVSDQFNPVYQANKSKLGNPIANVTSLRDGENQQKFEKGVIVSSSQGTFVVEGSIWTEIVKRGGIKSALGVPLKEAQDLGNGTVSQRFENGLLVVSNGNIFVLKPSKILDEYLKLGGPKGWLGIPKSNENDDGNKFLRQEFENGYIVWNGNEAVAYDRPSGVKISNRDKKGFKALEQIQRDYQEQNDSLDNFDLFGYKKEMTKKEADMLRKLDYWKIKEFFDISNNRQFPDENVSVIDKGRAFKEAARQFPDGESDGHQDAFRHAFWNILLAKSSSFGENWAKDFTTAHEGGPENKTAREAMDLYNNEVGRSIYQKNPTKSEEELSKLLKEAIHKGELLVIHSDLSLAWSDQVIPGKTGNLG
jgi:hypothetical protein